MTQQDLFQTATSYLVDIRASPLVLPGCKRGAEDDRHIWPEIFKIIQAKRPNWIVCENVFGHISLGLDQVLSDLEAEDYTCQPFVVPACAVNAPHRRDRVWIVGNTTDNGRNRGAAATGRTGQTDQPDQPGFEVRGEPSGSGQDVADTHSSGCQEQWWGEPAQSQYEAAKCGDWWSVEPPVGRLAHGIPDRVAQLKGLGNAIVPQIAMQIGLTIKAVEDEQTKG